MIEIIKELPDNVVGIVARGRVTNEECDNVLRPAMEGDMSNSDQTSLPSTACANCSGVNFVPSSAVWRGATPSRLASSASSAFSLSPLILAIRRETVA